MANRVLKNSWFHYGVLLAICLAAYFPAFIYPFAMADDYPFLWFSLTGEAKGIGNNFMWNTGRIPWAYLYPYLFKWAGSIPGLFLIRILTCGLVWLTACLFYNAFRKLGASSLIAITGATLVAVNPANGCVVAWAAAFNIALGNFLAAAAGTVYYTRYIRISNNWMKSLLVVVSIAFLLLVTLFYQITATMFVLAVYILAHPRIDRTLRSVLPVLISCGVFVVSSIIYYVVYWKWVVPNWGNPIYKELATIQFNFLEKLDILFDDLIYGSLSNWTWLFHPYASAVFGLINGLIVVLGIAVLVRKAGKAVFNRILMLILVGGAVIGPILLLAYKGNVPFRILGPTSALAACLIVIGLRSGISWLPRSAGVGNIYACMVLGLLPVLSAYTLYHGIVRLYNREYLALQNVVNEEISDGIPDKAIFIPPPRTAPHSVAGFGSFRSRYEYFGWYSMVALWAIDPAWNLIIQESQPDWIHRYRQEGIKFELLGTKNTNLPKIDIYSLLEPLPEMQTTDPLFGLVREYPSGYRYSPWFGYYIRSSDGWFYHQILGWTACLNPEGPEADGGIALKTRDTVWRCFEANFPSVVIGGKWYFLASSPDLLVWLGGARAFPVGGGESFIFGKKPPVDPAE